MEEEKQNQGATKSNNKTLTVIIIVFVILAVIGIAGYFAAKYLFKSLGEKAVEGILESEIGQNADVDYDDDGATLKSDEGTTSVGSKAEWPSDLPSSVPKVGSGDVNYSSTTEDGWYIMIENVSVASFDAYKTELEKNSWTIVGTTTTTDSGKSVQATNDQYDLYFVTYDDGKSVSLTVTKKSDI